MVMIDKDCVQGLCGSQEECLDPDFKSQMVDQMNKNKAEKPSQYEVGK